jgi:hypothetical protein
VHSFITLDRLLYLAKVPALGSEFTRRFTNR